MTRKVLVVILLSLGSVILDAQAFLGMSKDNVLKTMKKEFPNFNPDNSFINETYDYLKYISDDEQETWIILFDAKQKCNAVRVTCANSLMEKKREELNALYKRTGDDKWGFNVKKGLVSVELKNETWYFTITYILTQKK